MKIKELIRRMKNKKLKFILKINVNKLNHLKIIKENGGSLAKFINRIKIVNEVI